MNEQDKDIKELQGEELIRWISRAPLFTDSAEYEGMSLCFVNPELLKEETTQEEKPTPSEKSRTSA